MDGLAAVIDAMQAFTVAIQNDATKRDEIAAMLEAPLPSFGSSVVVGHQFAATPQPISMVPANAESGTRARL